MRSPRRFHLLALLVAAVALPSAAPARKAAAPAPEVLALWIDADERARAGDARGAVDRLTDAIEAVVALADGAEVRAPGGKRLARAAALHRLRLRAGDLASALALAWPAPLPHYERALRDAVDEAARDEARRRVEAARANLAAGVERAATFLIEELGSAVREEEPRDDVRGAPGTLAPEDAAWERMVEGDPRR